jgi:uncharacterized LabA/DUF88 family protein
MRRGLLYIESMFTAYCFIDGGYLRAVARQYGKPLVDPRLLADRVAYSGIVQTWRRPGVNAGFTKGNSGLRETGLARVVYYDARPDEKDYDSSPIAEYWKAVEVLPETEIGFGALRGRPRRQKKVDGLIAVDMMVGAFTNLFEVAILIAGDSDFVPVVDEVRRRGVMVVIAAVSGSLADELKRAADRIWLIDPTDTDAGDFPPLNHAGKLWVESRDGTVTVLCQKT